MIENFIKKLQSLGWKQKDIAGRVGLEQTFISRLSHGAKCSIETLISFSEAFNVSTDTVLGRTNERPLSPVEELLLKTTGGNEQIARAALRSAQGEKSLIDMEGERGKGRKGSIAA